MKKYLVFVAILLCGGLKQQLFAFQGAEPEAPFARIGISTLIATTTNTWTAVPATTTAPTPGRSALYLDLPTGTTAANLRVAFTSSTLSPEKQYGIGFASNTTPGEFTILASELPLRLDISEGIFVWVCTTSTVLQPPRVSAQEFKPRQPIQGILTPY